MTNLLALDSIFLFFQMSSPIPKGALSNDGLPHSVTSMIFWEYLIKSTGTAVMSSRPSDENIPNSEIPITDLHPTSLWIPDSLVSECQTCTKPFSLLVRKHHCRLCGRVVCGECSQYRMVLEKTNKPVRVCCSCYSVHRSDGKNRADF